MALGKPFEMAAAAAAEVALPLEESRSEKPEESEVAAGL